MTDVSVSDEQKKKERAWNLFWQAAVKSKEREYQNNFVVTAVKLVTANAVLSVKWIFS